MSLLPNSQRMAFRVDSKRKALIEQAAAASGQSVTDFAIVTLTREAQTILEQDQLRVLSNRDRDQFLAALAKPARPSTRLLRDARAYKQAKANGRIRSH
jgi:uncharacterized protein (DUF1778 family)